MADKKAPYKVTKLEGTIMVPSTKYDTEGKGLTTKMVEKPKGYLVSFPQGHSIHVRTETELKRLGFKVSGPTADETNDAEDDDEEDEDASKSKPSAKK